MSAETNQMVNVPAGGTLAGLRPLLLLIGVAAAVAAGVGVVLWSQGPTYSMVFGDLSDSEAVQIKQSLDQMGIPNKIENGAVSVPAERAAEARMQLAAKGLPSTGGFSVLEKDPGFGVSQFMENARYQHALEQELAHTIASLGSVEAARVHLAVPQQSAFVRDRRPATASVLLKLRAGQRLGREQVTAIVNLVASSVPGMVADQVTVVDGQGRLLSSPDQNSEFALREQQLDIARRMEEDYAQRIESLLTPLLGPGRVRAQVVAQIEMASTEEAREQYRPESQIVRSEQTSEQSSATGSGPQGVPGALTNQPPEAGVVQPPGAAPPVNAAAAAPGATPENVSRQATRNYEIDRTVAYTRQPAGRLQRLSVAVLIDNLRLTAADGTVTETPLTEEQLARINTLVRDAVGFDETRGDRVSVVNQSFLPESAVEAPEPASVPIWEKPMVRDIIKLVSGLVIVLLLLLFVVRPLIRNLTAGVRGPGLAPQLPPGAAMAGMPGGIEGQLAGAAQGGPAPPTRSGASIAYEQQIAQARSLVAKDPARVAQVVRDWVQKDE